MIKEEAIKDLEVIKDFFAENSGAIPVSIEYAIKALKQEPCEDTISRAELLKYNTVCMDDSGVNRFCVPTQIVRTLPSVTSTHKKGEWCKRNDDYFDWYECSECGYGSEGEMQYSRECDVRTKYCPNCGAEMESEE